MLAAFDIPLSWGELFRRTAKETSEDDVLGLAAQLAYYFFLALFPTVLFVLAIASFFPLSNFTDDAVRALQPIAPAEVLRFLEEQLMRISNADSGGILTIGILGAVWSSSAAVVSIIGSLNRAYDIDEGRPWWKVRLIAIGLTIALAVLFVASFTLIVVGPTIAERLATSFGLGTAFEWTWKIVQWPLAFFMVSTGIGLVYYFAPDAEQDWVWVTPGAVAATLLWFIVSLGFKFYVANVADYNATYGAVGGVIVLLLWFYISGIAVLVGAELNAEIEHASPWGKEPGEKVPGQKKKIGAAAARAYRERGPVSSTNKGSGMAIRMEERERTLGEMFAELSRDARTLMQQEMQLARAEISEKISAMSSGASFVVGGGLVAYGGLLAVIAAAVLGLIALGVPPWAGALIGGVVAAAIGYALIRSGLNALKPQALVPRQTMDTLKEDVRWIKAHAK